MRFSQLYIVDKTAEEVVDGLVQLRGRNDPKSGFVSPSHTANFLRARCDTAENEPCKVCPLSVYRSPRFLHGPFINIANIGNTLASGCCIAARSRLYTKEIYRQKARS